MPFTPFHLGPAAFLKTVFKRFSFTIFGFSQLVMDSEPLYFIFRQEMPVHRIFHTFLGCNIVVFITVLTGRPLCRLGLRIWNKICGSSYSLEISFPAALVSAACGAYSHIILDGLMHRDMQPFWPFISGNPMLGHVTSSTIYFFCKICFASALLIYLLKKLAGQRCD